MKNIIKKPKHFKATCNYCGVIFTYQLQDRNKEYYDRCYHFIDTVGCPNCGQDIKHSVENAVYRKEVE